MLPLAATLSCSRVLTEEQEDSPIAFTSAVTVKAPVETSGDLDGTSGFAVWATHQGGEPTALADLLMDGVQVYRTGNEWAYDRVRMWQEGQWHFEAFYPYPKTLAPEAGQTGRDVLSTGLHFSKDGSQSAAPEGVYIDYYYSPAASHDLMTASQTVSYRGTASPVQLQFDHLLSRVSIAGRAENGNVTINSITLTGVSESGSYDSSAGWSGLATGSGFTASNIRLTGATTDVIGNRLMIPQPVSGMEVAVTYTPEGASAALSATYELPATELISRWEPGRSYRYTFVVYGNRIIFDKPTVTAWDDATGGIIVVE